MKCEATKPQVEIDKETVSFDRILCHGNDKMAFINIKNSSKVLCNWKIKKRDDEESDAGNIFNFKKYNISLIMPNPLKI